MGPECTGGFGPFWGRPRPPLSSRLGPDRPNTGNMGSTCHVSHKTEWGRRISSKEVRSCSSGRYAAFVKQVLANGVAQYVSLACVAPHH